MSANANLHKAKTAKNDEFYTQMPDVENELMHYKNHFAGKIVFCNCDDPTWSAFWKYFHLNFEHLGLKKLISTHYDREKSTYKMEYEGGDDTNLEAGVKTPLVGNGDFRNQECLDLLDESDIVVTNPPFSSYRIFVATLIEHKKDFIIWSNNNSITYKEIFPLIKDNQMWLGYTANKTLIFRLADDYEKWDEKITKERNDGHKYGKVPAISVFTNLDIKKRHEDLILYKHYSPSDFPRYDNYEAINVDKVSDIPMDYCESWEVTEEEFEKLGDNWEKVRGGFREYPTVFVIPAKGTELRQALHEHADGYREMIEKALGDALYDPGVIGVPITFLDKYNPDQFEITNPADIAKDILTDSVDTDDASTDRQTDRQTSSGGLPGDLERVAGARSGRMACCGETQVRSDLCPADTVTASSECQSPFSISTIRDSSGLSDTNTISAEMAETALNTDSSNTTDEGSTSASLSARYCNGVMGVPITFLDKYNPEQFEIVGLAPERLASDHSRLQVKRYENATQHNRDGSTCGGNKVNDGPTILHNTIPKKYPYYTSITVPKSYIEVLYARILLRKKVRNTK